MSPILQVDHLFKRFGGLAATNDCNLEIAAGEVHALIGPNGAGKTTLLAQLSGELASDAVCPPDGAREPRARRAGTHGPLLRRAGRGGR
jgi:ABC-type hemin transport system ATPase subunit